MIEGLVILRDIILAVVLSWIGVDYPAEKDHSTRHPSMFTTADNSEVPMLLLTSSQPVKQSFGCSNGLMQS